MLDQNNIVTVLSMIGGIVAFCVSTYFVVRQLQANKNQAHQDQLWNRRKGSEEILNTIIMGEFPSSLEKLAEDFGWNITRRESYESLAARIDPGSILVLDLTLRKLLRHLEVISINMKHGIIDETICFEYLMYILTSVVSNSRAFIAKERAARNAPTVFSNADRYCNEWTQKLADRLWLRTRFR